MKVLGTFSLAPNRAALGFLVVTILLGSCRSVPETGRDHELVVRGAASPPPPALSSVRSGVGRQGDDPDARFGSTFTSSTWDEVRDTFHSPGLFVGAKLAVGDVNGDFDGDTAVVDDVAAPTEFIFIPDIESSAGVGIDIGYRWEQYELLFSWLTIDYDAEFTGASLDTRIQYIDLMFRQYYWIDQRLQPFVTAGIGLSEGTIDNGAVGPLGVQDGKILDGVTYNIGAGVAFYPHPWLSVFGMALYRFGRYDSVDGTFGKIQVESTLDADAWEISTGITFRLLGGAN